MKALTVLHPWAQLLALGIKGAETRSWSTAYRGPLAIHAGKRYRTVNSDFAHVMRSRGILPATPFRFGEVLAIAQLVNVIPTPEARGRFSPLELELGGLPQQPIRVDPRRRRAARARRAREGCTRPVGMGGSMLGDFVTFEELHVAPLDASRRLRDLGFPDDTFFGWYPVAGNRPYVALPRFTVTTGEPIAPAYTIAEMRDWLSRRDLLPDVAPRFETTMWRDRNGAWWHDVSPACGELTCGGHASEAEATSLLLIALVQRSVLDPTRLR